MLKRTTILILTSFIAISYSFSDGLLTTGNMETIQFNCMLQDSCASANIDNLESSLTQYSSQVSAVNNSENTTGIIPSYNNITNKPTNGDIKYNPLKINENPYLSWTYVNYDNYDQDAFLIQVSTDTAFSTIFSSYGKTDYSNHGTIYNYALPEGQYYWRVKVWDKYWKEWSEYSGEQNIICKSTASITTTLSQLLVSANSVNRIYFNSGSDLTQYAIMASLNNSYLAGDGSLQATPVWKTSAGWGGYIDHYVDNTNYNYEYKIMSIDSYGNQGIESTLATPCFDIIYQPAVITNSSSKTSQISILNKSRANVTVSLQATITGNDFICELIGDANKDGIVDQGESIISDISIPGGETISLIAKFTPLNSNNTANTCTIPFKTPLGFTYKTISIALENKCIDEKTPNDPEINVSNNLGVKISWAAVTKNTDASEANDISGYRAEKTDVLENGFSALGFTSGLEYTDTSPVKYYRVITVDNSGNESPGLNITSYEGKKIALSDDGMLYASNCSADRIRINKSNTPKSNMVEYTIAIENKFDNIDVFVNTGKYTFNTIAAKAIAKGQAKPEVASAFYYNGVEMIPITYKKVSANGIGTFKAFKSGSYSLSTVVSRSAFGITKVAPRVFTPTDCNGINDEIIIYYQNTDNKPISSKIFDVRGAVIADDLKDTGVALIWDGKDKNGSVCEEGIYIYQVNIGNEVNNGACVLAK